MPTPAQPPIRRFSLALGKGRVAQITETEDEYVVHDVSAMTTGPAQGHMVEVELPDGTKQEHQIYCDATTLAGLEQCASTFTTGVKVKADHGSGVMSVAGYLNAFHRGKDEEGNEQSRCDFHVLKTFGGVKHLMELIRKLSDTMGFSASFDQALQRIGDKFFARCEQVFSVDFVSEPAANPSGVFSSGVDTRHKFQTETPMADNPPSQTPEQFAAACMAALKPHLDAIHSRIGKLEERGMPTATTVSPAADTDGLYNAMEAKFASSAKISDMVKGVVAAELQNTSKTLAALGFMPGKGPASSDPNLARDPNAKKVEDMTFTELVEAEFANPANKHRRDFDIVQGLVKAYPAKHAQAIKDRALARMPVRKVPFVPAA